MIRLLLLTILPLIAPYVVWYVWQVFCRKPVIDPATGEQVPPDFEKAPRGKLLAAGLVLMALTVGGFLVAHRLIAEDPYVPMTVDEFEKRQNRDADGR